MRDITWIGPTIGGAVGVIVAMVPLGGGPFLWIIGGLIGSIVGGFVQRRMLTKGRSGNGR